MCGTQISFHFSALDPWGSHTTFAQLANPFTVLIKNLHCRRELGVAAPRGQTFHSPFPVSPDPLSQCRSRYTAFQANNATVLQAKKQLQPPGSASMSFEADHLICPSARVFFGAS